MTPSEAYDKALEEGPGDKTRRIACRDPEWAYRYARYVDQAPRDDTRAGASRDPDLAYCYALEIDRWLHPRAANVLSTIQQASIEEELEFD